MASVFSSLPQFERIALVIGVGGEQEKVEVIRGGK